MRPFQNIVIDRATQCARELEKELSDMEQDIGPGRLLHPLVQQVRALRRIVEDLQVILSEVDQ